MRTLQSRFRIGLLSWSHVALLALLRCLGPVHGPVSVLMGRPDAIIQRSRHIRTWRRFEHGAPDESILQTLRAFVDEERVDVLVANDEGSVAFLARHREAVNRFVRTTPTASPAALARVMDKRRFTELAAELGLPHPRSVMSDDPAGDLPGRIRAELNFPVVVKPADLTCGFGVERCDDPSAAAAAIGRLQAEGRPFLVQECFAGHDLDFCLVAHEGRIVRWTSRMNVGGKARFGAPGQWWELRRRPELLAAMERLVARTQWSGAMDVDCLWQPATGEWRVLECNPRFGSTTLADATAGVNLPDALVRLGLGLAVPETECHPQRFYSGGLGLRAMLGLHRGPRLRLRETYLPHVLRDPGPEIAAQRLARAARRDAGRPQPAPPPSFRPASRSKAW